jgi:hypothetical protein
MSPPISQPMSLTNSRRALKTLTPDKFFSDYVFGLKLRFFRTRFGKMGWRGVKMVSDCHCVCVTYFGS